MKQQQINYTLPFQESSNIITIQPNIRLERAPELFKAIQEQSKLERYKWQQNNSGKMLSTAVAYSSCTKPFDADKVAGMCSQNPRHEYYGLPVAEIKAKWAEKAQKAADRGNLVDDAITALCMGKDFMCSKDADHAGRMPFIENFYTMFASKLGRYVGSEIWLTSAELGCCVRCDALFVSDKQLTICEWKNNDKIDASNKWSKCHGVLEGYDDCDLLKYNLQVYTYKYIVESYNLGLPVKVAIIQFNNEGFFAQPILLENTYKELIPKLYKYANDCKNKS